MGERLELERQRYLIGLYMVAFLAMFVLSLLTPKYADDFAYADRLFGLHDRTRLY